MGFFARSSPCKIQSARRMMCFIAQQEAIEETERIRALGKKSKFQYSVKKTSPVYPVVYSDSIINQIMRSGKPINDEQWSTIREELCKNFKSTESNVDTRVCDICSHYENNVAIKSYYQFLKRKNYKMNLNLMSLYLKTFYDLKITIDSEKEQEICQIYDNIRKQYPLLDGKTCTGCILALSMTKRWKETVELLDMLKLSINPSIQVIGAIVCAAFRNKDPEFAWQLIKNFGGKTPLSHTIYTAYLKYCQEHFKGLEFEKEIEKMFFVWREQYILPPQFVIDAYAEAFKSLPYSVRFTSIFKRGCCDGCEEELTKTSLADEEFKILSHSVLKKLIIGESILRQTSPEELKRYMLFLKTIKPYDVVIDGLNVAFSARRADEKGSLKPILEMAKIFKKENKRVLVLGRAHMSWWCKTTLEEIKRNADFFFLKNMTQDDPFLLHITLVSGPQTYFVSRDLMRQHKHQLINENVDMLFKKWQLSRQYTFMLTKDKPGFRLIQPLPYEPIAQKNKDGWHLPYSHLNEYMLPNVYSMPKHWLCLKKKRIFLTHLFKEEQ